MFGYFWIDGVIEKYFCVDSKRPSKDFKATTNDQKNYYMRHFEASRSLVGGNGILERQDDGLFYSLCGISKQDSMNQ